MVKAGNTFAGWNETADLTGAFHPDTFKADKNITLNADWVSDSVKPAFENLMSASNGFPANAAAVNAGNQDKVFKVLNAYNVQKPGAKHILSEQKTLLDTFVAVAGNLVKESISTATPGATTDAHYVWVADFTSPPKPDEMQVNTEWDNVNGVVKLNLTSLTGVDGKLPGSGSGFADSATPGTIAGLFSPNLFATIAPGSPIPSLTYVTLFDYCKPVTNAADKVILKIKNQALNLYDEHSVPSGVVGHGTPDVHKNITHILADFPNNVASISGDDADAKQLNAFKNDFLTILIWKEAPDPTVTIHATYTLKDKEPYTVTYVIDYKDLTVASAGIQQ